MDHLTANFHALEGDTLHEKRKSFNRLLIQIEQELTTDEDLNAFAFTLAPRNKLEDILKVEILLKFQRNDALLDILKGGDVILIRKVLNCWRFFETAFVNIDAETLVNDVFLHTSFSTRMKVLTKLAINLKSETVADSYFEAVETKYGLQTASAILPACSLNLIKSKVETFKVKLSERQLMKIFKKFPEFLMYYFDTSGTSGDYNNLIKHVARIDVELFWKIQEKYNLCVKFGRHMTPYMYANEHLKKYQAKNFNFKEVYAILKNDERKLRDFFVSLYPEDIQNFYSTYSRHYSNALIKFIRYIPKSNRFAVINACFKESYGENLSEYKREEIPENLLKIMPAEEREVIIDQKILKDESYMYMWPADKTIKAVDERIKGTTDPWQREQLLLQLYKTCVFNEDQKALLNVVQYFCKKYKNNEKFSKLFINQLAQWKNLERLSDEHWAHINKLIKPSLISCSLYNDYIFMTSYFKRKMHLNDPPDESLKFLFEKMIERKSLCYVIHEQKKFGKRFLEYLAGLIPDVFEGDEYQKAAVWILKSIVLHNKQNSRSKIPLSNYSKLLQVAKFYLSKEHEYEAITIFKYCIRYEHNTDDEYDGIFWEHYEKLYDTDILMWYLRNKPLRLFQKIDEVFKHTSSHILNNGLSSIFKLFAMYAFCDGIMEKVINFAKNSLKTENIYTANFAIMALAHLTDPQSFFNATNFLYPPEDGKIDYENTAKIQLERQEAVAKSLVAIQNPDLCLPFLLTFCKGDYLKYAYKPLYCIATHATEINLNQFFETLSTSAVSARKHAVYLITLVSPKEKIYSFLKQAGESDKHATVQKVVFKNTLKFFLSDQTENFWDLLQCNIKIMDKDDTEAYDHLVKIKRIPSDYLARYIELIYDILTKHESKQIQDKKWNLLDIIPDEMFKSLNQEFLKKTINETLFTRNCSDFWVRCLFYTAKQNQEEVLLFTFGLFKNYYNCHLPNSTGNISKELLQNVRNFVSNFCSRAIRLNAGETLMKKFMDLWSETVTKKGFDEELLQLHLTQDYLSCHSEDKLFEFVDKLNVLLINWVKQHRDASVVLLFAEKLNSLLSIVINPSRDHEKLVKFLEKFCSSNDFPYNCNYTVAIKILSIQANSTINFRKNFGGVIAKLRDSNVPDLRIRFGQILKSLVA